MTDDLDMGAILNEFNLEETVRCAIGAGNDLAMICHRVPAIEEALGYLKTLPTDQLDRALRNVARFKVNLAVPDRFSESAFTALNNEIWDLRVATLWRRARTGAKPGRRQTLAGRNLLSPPGRFCRG